MAHRPIFMVNDVGNQFVLTKMLEFRWFPGMSISQKQKSIDSLHSEAYRVFKNIRILEISSKSKKQLGIDLSAFNLSIITKSNRTFSVESAYQASKVFTNGGPYSDLLNKSSKDAKKDPRLKSSGVLKCFRFAKTNWPLYPRTLFYDWLYINALNKNHTLKSEIMEYMAFTDIEFNPENSISCQAYSAALYVSLTRRSLLTEALSSKQSFMELVEKTQIQSEFNNVNIRQNLHDINISGNFSRTKKSTIKTTLKTFPLWDSSQT
jgi:hypothetical protein